MAFILIRINRVLIFKVTAGIIFTLLFFAPSASIIQNASASQPTAQITLAQADGSNIVKDTLITLTPGKTNSLLSFEFRGFDVTDHIVELRCSFDGISYLKNNCVSQSEESQSSFPGPDGVQTNYYVKTGKAYRQVIPIQNPKTYTFGVKVLNDKNELSPAVTWTFKMRAVTDAPLIGTTDGTPSIENTKKIKRVTVHFDSIEIWHDHDEDKPSGPKDPGDWYLWAFVQRKMVNLVQSSVYEKQKYQFEGKQITVYIREDLPLSIFTVGIESDSLWCKANEARLAEDATKIFWSQPYQWEQKIRIFQGYGDGRVNYPGIRNYVPPQCAYSGLLYVLSHPGDLLTTDIVGERGLGYTGSDFKLSFTIIARIL
jgi:hypothetical protein